MKTLSSAENPVGARLSGRSTVPPAPELILKPAIPLGKQRRHGPRSVSMTNLPGVAPAAPPL